MSKIANAWGKVVSTVKGAARSTKKSVVRTVDVAKQKSAIAHKQSALQDMYVELAKYICRSCNDGTLRLNGSGVIGSVEVKDHISEYLILEAEFKDEIQRMEKMLHWLQNHEVQAKDASPAAQDGTDTAGEQDGKGGTDADSADAVDVDAADNGDPDTDTDTNAEIGTDADVNDGAEDKKD